MVIRPRRDDGGLAVTGMVAGPRRLEVADLEALPGQVEDVGEVAPGFSGRAVPLRALLDMVEPSPEAAFVTVESDDGFYRASVPLADLVEKGWLIHSLGKRRLPRDRGGPFRLVVPEGRTLCWNVKGVAELRFTAQPEPDSVPENPPH